MVRTDYDRIVRSQNTLPWLSNIDILESHAGADGLEPDVAGVDQPLYHGLVLLEVRERGVDHAVGLVPRHDGAAAEDLQEPIDHHGDLGLADAREYLVEVLLHGAEHGVGDGQVVYVEGQVVSVGSGNDHGQLV